MDVSHNKYIYMVQVSFVYIYMFYTLGPYVTNSYRVVAVSACMSHERCTRILCICVYLYGTRKMCVYTYMYMLYTLGPYVTNSYRAVCVEVCVYIYIYYYS